ncbi:CynX/NimT family MFS transporter [Edaphovirga cremea]|uniref:MFS transporter n=1 Tax=Edaphovirga cremea TaxID=2267246 RepID=UPI00398986B7
MSQSTPLEVAPTAATRRRFVPLLGIILVSLNLRAGVTSLSAIYGFIAQDVTGFNVPLLGVIPVLCFALFGALATTFSRRMGYECALMLSMLMIFIGIALRSFAHTFPLFVLWSLISLAGMGFGNVLIQPLIKKYFPSRIGPITAAFAVMLAVSGGFPPIVAVPITAAFGWRANVFLWAIVALMAAVPWFVVLLTRQKKSSAAAAILPEPQPAATPQRALNQVKVWKWPVAWSMVILFGVGMMSMYTMLNWLPTVLIQQGISVNTAGSILGVYIILGVFHSILLPIYLGRMKNPYIVVCVAGVLQITGYMGYLYAPAYVWVWTVITAPGLMTIPTTFQLINLRTRTVAGAASLSAFTQGIGYVFAGVGPFLFGYFYALSGDWQVSFWFLTAMSILMVIAGGAAVRPKFLEDAQRRSQE